MRAVKVTLVAVLAALVAVGVSTTSYAFHSGGVAECEGCHTDIVEARPGSRPARIGCECCHGPLIKPAQAPTWRNQTPPAWPVLCVRGHRHSPYTPP